jgi:predicted amidohydrolase
VIVALASPRAASSIDDGLSRIKRLMGDAASRGAEIVCFPEAYLPGLRGQDFDVPAFERDDEFRALFEVSSYAREHRIAVILGMEHIADEGRLIAAFVIGADGQLLGIQTKNQLDPSEDRFYIPGTSRRVFEINGVTVGIVICHEGWRYPETVRWAATRGAKIVFHPSLTGYERTVAPELTAFGSLDAPYYENAMRCRAIENTIYFASVNYAVRYPEAATALITPSGECQACLPYGEEGVLVAEIDVAAATRLIASRYAPDRYQELTPG